MRRRVCVHICELCVRGCCSFLWVRDVQAFDEHGMLRSQLWRPDSPLCEEGGVEHHALVEPPWLCRSGGWTHFMQVLVCSAERPHKVAMASGETGESYCTVRVGVRAGDDGVAIQRMCTVLRHDAIDSDGGIIDIRVHEVSLMHPPALLLVQRYPLGKLLQVFLRHLQQIPFDAQMTEERHGDAGHQRRLT